jgi:uncharacterized hydantoinase/oxoprolinase family protein
LGKSQEDSTRRLARLLCADPWEAKDFILDLCSYVHEEQVRKIADSMESVSNESGLENFYVAGLGRKLGIQAASLLDKPATDWNLPCLGLVEMLINPGLT